MGQKRRKRRKRSVRLLETLANHRRTMIGQSSASAGADVYFRHRYSPCNKKNPRHVAARTRPTRCTREQECDCTRRAPQRQALGKFAGASLCRRAPRDPRHIFPSAGSARSTGPPLLIPLRPAIRSRRAAFEIRIRRTFEPSDRMKKKRRLARSNADLILRTPKCIEPITEFVVTNERWM